MESSMRTIFSISLKEVDDGFLFEATAIGRALIRRHYPTADQIELEKLIRDTLEAGAATLGDPGPDPEDDDHSHDESGQQH